MKKVLLGCAAICMLFGACKPSDSNNAKSRAEILKTGKWMLTAEKSVTTIAGVSAPETDEYATLSACEKDDLSIYRADMHLIADEGATKCNSSDPQQSDEGTWALTDSDTKISFTNGTDVYSGSILQLDDSILKLKITETYTMSGITYSIDITATFTHVN